VSREISISRLLNTSVEKVWKAITDKDEMKQWYFDIADFQLQIGFEFRFYAGSKEKQWLHVCKITEIVAGKKLTYSWRYDGYSGISYVTFELFNEGDVADCKAGKTRVKLTHSGLESFPGETVPELKKENFAEGWNHIVGTSLKEYLEKK